MTDFYHRKLPHWIPEGAAFFIIFRLANSLPARVIQELEAWREHERQTIQSRHPGKSEWQELYNLDKKYFGYFDFWLDRCVENSPRWLSDEKIAQIVADEIHALNGDCYRLIAYCIMSNHVHLAMDTDEYRFEPAHEGVTAPYTLTDTLKRLKGRTARFCNLALGRSGTFWHSESYDHVIRNAKEYERIIWYILTNPVKAGLVEKWEDWKFSYVSRT